MNVYLIEVCTLIAVTFPIYRIGVSGEDSDHSDHHHAGLALTAAELSDVRLHGSKMGNDKLLTSL